MIKINDRYFIAADKHCYKLQVLLQKDEEKELDEDEKKEEKEDSYFTIGYYTTLDSLFKGLTNKKLRKFVSKKDIYNLQELKNEIIKLKDFIESLDLKI